MDSSKKKNPQKSVITKRYKIPDEVRRTSEYLKKKSTCNVYTDPSLKTRLIQTDIVKKFKVPNYDISKMNKIDTRTHLCVASTNQRIQANGS